MPLHAAAMRTELKDERETLQLTEHGLVLITQMGMCADLQPHLVQKRVFVGFFLLILIL